MFVRKAVVLFAGMALALAACSAPDNRGADGSMPPMTPTASDGSDCHKAALPEERNGQTVQVNIDTCAHPIMVEAKVTAGWAQILNTPTGKVLNQPSGVVCSPPKPDAKCFPLAGQTVKVVCFLQDASAEWYGVLLGKKSSTGSDGDISEFTNDGDLPAAYVSADAVAKTDALADCQTALHNKDTRQQLYGNNQPAITLDPNY